ncbi:MAG: flagellar basal body protein, partial [Rhodospirillales bacterium]|nr:flagellar basal body protein [Rhodospirillales bacterium]
MSLEITLQNAISGLQTSQQSLQVISNNIANVNVEGYTKKTIEQTSRVITGQGYGVELALVSRDVDEGVLKQLRVEQGTL